MNAARHAARNSPGAMARWPSSKTLPAGSTIATVTSHRPATCSTRPSPSRGSTATRTKAWREGSQPPDVTAAAGDVTAAAGDVTAAAGTGAHSAEPPANANATMRGVASATSRSVAPTAFAWASCSCAAANCACNSAVLPSNSLTRRCNSTACTRASVNPSGGTSVALHPGNAMQHHVTAAANSANDARRGVMLPPVDVHAESPAYFRPLQYPPYRAGKHHGQDAPRPSENPHSPWTPDRQR